MRNFKLLLKNSYEQLLVTFLRNYCNFDFKWDFKNFSGIQSIFATISFHSQGFYYKTFFTVKINSAGLQASALVSVGHFSLYNIWEQGYTLTKWSSLGDSSLRIGSSLARKYQTRVEVNGNKHTQAYSTTLLISTVKKFIALTPKSQKISRLNSSILRRGSFV